jgi:hypothetical protein
MRITRKTKQFAIFVIDLVLLYAAIWVSLVVRTLSFPGLPRFWEHLVSFTPVMPLWIVVFYTMRLYALETPFDDVNFLGRLAAAIGVSTLLTALFLLKPFTFDLTQNRIAHILHKRVRIITGLALPAGQGIKKLGV